MATLLDSAWVNGRLEKTWVTTNDFGQRRYVHETIQDVEPAIEHVKKQAQNARDCVLGRFKAEVSFTHIEELARITCKMWGITQRECFAEIMQGKTDRAQKALKVLTEGSDYAKLQARYYK